MSLVVGRVRNLAYFFNQRRVFEGPHNSVTYAFTSLLL